MFSNGSWSSISLAIVTPSFVIVGGPNFLSSTTLRPFGPSVILTASASASIPRLSARRASSLYSSCFAGMCVTDLLVGAVADHDGQNVGFAQDQQLILVELELGARVLGEQNLLALLHVGDDALTGIEDPAWPDSENLALLGLLLCGIRQDDAALCDLLALEWLDYHPV